MALLLILSGLLTLLFFGLLVGSERGVRRFYPLLLKAPLGLSQSLRHVLDLEPMSRAPEIVVFQSPVPGAFAVRALGGRGTIFLSQGMICQFNESELRHTLTIAVRHLRFKRAPLESLCWLMTLLLTRWAPAPWVQLNSSSRKLSRSLERKLSPFSAIVFWLLYPLIGFFKRWSEGRSVLYGKEAGALPIQQKMIWSTLLSGLLSGFIFKL